MTDSGGPDAAAVERSIRRLTNALRAGESPPQSTARPATQADSKPQAGWWVLAVGDPLDPEDFDARDAARERLADRVARAGIVLQERVWVWDETNRAQLRLLVLPGRAEAEELSRRLRERGLPIRVRPAQAS